MTRQRQLNTFARIFIVTIQISRQKCTQTDTQIGQYRQHRNKVVKVGKLKIIEAIPENSTQIFMGLAKHCKECKFSDLYTEG